jgi:hypothetical protein
MAPARVQCDRSGEGKATFEAVDSQRKAQALADLDEAIQDFLARYGLDEAEFEAAVAAEARQDDSFS